MILFYNNQRLKNPEAKILCSKIHDSPGRYTSALLKLNYGMFLVQSWKISTSKI